MQTISADIAGQALEHDVVDELQVFMAPVFLGDGIRNFDMPGGRRFDWELVGIYTANPRAPIIGQVRALAAVFESCWSTR